MIIRKAIVKLCVGENLKGRDMEQVFREIMEVVLRPSAAVRRCAKSHTPTFH